MQREIRIRVSRKVSPEEQEIIELCRGVGILTERDTDATLARIIRELMDFRDREIGCSELARVSGLNRITCIHHMKRLERAGIVEKGDSKYKPLFEDFEGLVERMRERMLSDFEDFERLARDIDSELEIDETRERRVVGSERKLELPQKPRKRIKIEVD